MDGDKKPETKEPQEGGWTYRAEGEKKSPVHEEPRQQTSALNNSSTVEWTASEYVAHHKGFGWYIALGLITLAVAYGVYRVSDLFSALVIVVIAIVFGVAAGHKPRVLTYRLDEAGLTISRKFYPYSDLRSFALIKEGAFTNITFLPLKRFMPALTIYFAPEDESKIVDVLSQYLPLEPGGRDMVDRLMHRIRF